jgi:lipid A ethanolaminephosphotransferase
VSHPIVKNLYPRVRLEVTNTLLIVAYALASTFYLNRHVLDFIYHLPIPQGFHNLFFEISVTGLLFSTQILLCLPFLLLGITKWAVIAFSFLGFVTSYFAVRYGILFDSTVAESVFITNSSEISQYFNLNLFINLAFILLLCIFVFFRVRLKPANLVSRLITTAKLFLGCLLFIILSATFFYKDFASFFRNNRQVRSMVTPHSPLYQIGKHISHSLFPKKYVFVSIGQKAVLQPSKPEKPKIVVLVLGETARADHFSLNGYHDNLTNPLLAKENIIAFQNFTSCGTATATSVPCIFSDLTRENFRPELALERGNLLDVAKAAGYKVTWIDNNTGCQGVCARTGEMNISHLMNSDLCPGKTCYDTILIEALKTIAPTPQPQLIVLHTLGSHGPSYHLRYPEKFKKFQPSCDTSELSDCTKEQVINTYDNTILFTDSIVAGVIDHLKSLKGTDAAMFYISDHGESLGENGIYLHSLPYFLAPMAQKHVPAILWFSENFLSPEQAKYLKDKKLPYCGLSHDFVFSSMLTMMGIETPEYKSKNDFFRLNPATCKAGLLD